jgi:fucose permease
MNQAGALVRETKRKSSATACILSAFVVAGVVTTLLGPILPFLISRWSMNDQQAGLFFTFQFGCSMAGVASVSMLLPHWGYKFTLCAGFVAVACGVAGLNSTSHAAGLAATALYGYGLGLVLPSSNLWIAEAAESRRVAALSILNFTWGIGAIACSPLVLLAARHGALAIFLYALAALNIAAGLILLIVDLKLPTLKAEPLTESADVSVARTAAVVLGALFFLYVGTENSVAGWAAAFARRMGTKTPELWALAPMFFWGGLMVGRAAVPINPLRHREKLLVSIGLLAGLVGTATLVEIRAFWPLALCVGVAGLGFAAIYPVLVAWMAKQFGERARRVGSLMFALAGLGAAVMPWTVGLVSTRAGGLRTGLFIPAAGCAAMLLLLVGIPKQLTN